MQNFFDILQLCRMSLLVDEQKIAAMISKQIPMTSLSLVWIYHKEN